MLIPMFAGCWEEVQYQPTQESATVTDKTNPQPAPPTEETTPADTQEAAETKDNITEGNITDDTAEVPPASEPAEEQPALEDPTPEDSEEEDPLFSPSPETPSAQEVPVDPIRPADEPVTTEPSADPAEESTTPDSAHDSSAVWQLSSKWSLAAGYFAKGLGADRYGTILDQAKTAADTLNVDLPDFSTLDTQNNRQAAVAGYLLNDSGPSLARQFQSPQSALAELAIESHALLLVYTPRNQNLDALIASIRSAAEKSSLPATIWQPLVDLLEQRAPYQEVKQAVFELHRQTAAHLGTLSTP